MTGFNFSWNLILRCSIICLKNMLVALVRSCLLLAVFARFSVNSSYSHKVTAFNWTKDSKKWLWGRHRELGKARVGVEAVWNYWRWETSEMNKICQGTVWHHGFSENCMPRSGPFQQVDAKFCESSVTAETSAKPCDRQVQRCRSVIS